MMQAFSLFKRRNALRVPVFTYHSLHVPGTDYTTNDHIALEEDLKVIRDRGFRVVNVRRIVDAVIGTRSAPQGRCVGITFDDGPDFDFADVERPELGLVKSFARILREAALPPENWVTLASALRHVVRDRIAGRARDSRSDLHRRTRRLDR